MRRVGGAVEREGGRDYRGGRCVVRGLSGGWEPRARIRADQGRRRVGERLAEEGGVCDSTVRG